MTNNYLSFDPLSICTVHTDIFFGVLLALEIQRAPFEMQELGAKMVVNRLLLEIFEQNDKEIHRLHKGIITSSPLILTHIDQGGFNSSHVTELAAEIFF